jgi:hypothetical protein
MFGQAMTKTTSKSQIARNAILSEAEILTG